MKCFRRYFCVLLCLVLLSGVFSVGVSAADELEGYKVYQYYKYPTSTNRGGLTFTPHNAEEEKKENFYSFGNALPDGNVMTGYKVYNADSDTLFTGGRKLTINFNNIYYSILYEDIFNGELLQQEYITSPSSVYASVKYTDGSTSNEDVTFVKKSDKIVNFKLEFTPDKDIQEITFFAILKDLDVIVHDGISQPGHTFDVTFYCGEYNGDDKYQFSFEVSSEEAGLLAGIIEWLKNLWNSILEIPQKVADSFAYFFDDVFLWLEQLWDSIAELPSKIWGFIEDGLKSLFVPNDEFIVQFKDDIDGILSDRFGAVYQVVNLLTDSWDRINNYAQTSIIEIPQATIDLPDNAKFTFGGYTVEVVPEGFEWIVEILKMIVGIVCTVLFVNGLRKKYEEVMGVEK